MQMTTLCATSYNLFFFQNIRILDSKKELADTFNALAITHEVS